MLEPPLHPGMGPGVAVMQLGCIETFLGSGSELCITRGWKQSPPLRCPSRPVGTADMGPNTAAWGLYLEGH